MKDLYLNFGSYIFDPDGNENGIQSVFLERKQSSDPHTEIFVNLYESALSYSKVIFLLAPENLLAIKSYGQVVESKLSALEEYEKFKTYIESSRKNYVYVIDSNKPDFPDIWMIIDRSFKSELSMISASQALGLRSNTESVVNFYLHGIKENAYSSADKDILLSELGFITRNKR